MKHYVLGFAYDRREEAVLLMVKARPEWQRGRMNGVGGEIKSGETPRQAMVREFREETSVETDEDKWTYFACIEANDHTVHCFAAVNVARMGEGCVKNQDKTEPLIWVYYALLQSCQFLIPNLKYLIPLAVTQTIGTGERLCLPVKFLVEREEEPPAQPRPVIVVPAA